MLVLPPVAIADDGAPLMVLLGEGPRAEAVEQGLSKVLLRDGGALVDLSPKPPKPLVGAQELRHAVAAYQAFDYGKALSHLSVAMAELGHRGGAGLSTSELSDLFIYRALVRHAQADTAAAWDDFVRAATIDPTRHLDAARFSPSVVASFERARVKVHETEPTALTINTEVTNCDLVLDGRSVAGETAVAVRTGEHYLRVRCLGYVEYGQQVFVQGKVMSFKPPLHATEVPDHQTAIALANKRGFEHVIWVRVTGGDNDSTAVFVLYDSSGESLARTGATLRDVRAARDASEVAVSRLLDKLAPVIPISMVAPVPEEPWYKNRWLWAAAGVAATTAVLLPFALSESSAPGFRVELGGDTP